MIILDLILILIFSFLLVKATDLLVVNFDSLSQKTRLRKFALTGLVLGLATSLPELFVGLSAAIEEKPILSLGNIMGANIANLSLVIGGAALIGGAVKVQGTFLRRDIFYAFLAATSPMLLISDKVLSRIDGLILLLLYVFYQIAVFSEKTGVREKAEDKHLRLLRKLEQRETRKELAWIVLAIALLLFSAETIVKLATKLALASNLPTFLIGLLLVSLGTTLPELVFEIKAISKRQPGMALGNLLGSIVVNGTLVIGLVSLISPVRLQSFNAYLFSTMVFLLVFGLFYFFVRTKQRLDRWEGALLLLLYLTFVIGEFIKL